MTIVAIGLVFADIRTVLAATITSGVSPVPAGWTVATNWMSAFVTISAAAVGLAILLAGWRTVSQTTLRSAWWWTLAALGFWSATELAAALHAPGAGTTWLAPARLAAIELSFGPMVALLGAKRPQHAVWNLVVLSLFGIVALPAAETFFLHPGQRLTLGEARRWFLWILVLVGPINFVPTRYWLASVLVATGQIVALAGQLALIGRPLAPQAELVGLVLCVVGLVTTRLMPAKRVLGPYDLLWVDFRDSFGLFWALRVQERVNAAAKQSDWGVELTWRGFARRTDGTTPAAIDAAIEPAVRGTLTSLLRRFVSREWIAERLKRSLD